MTDKASSDNIGNSSKRKTDTIHQTNNLKESNEQLSTMLTNNSPKTENLVHGDEINRRNEPNIICECQPNAHGAAVPIVQPATSNNLPSSHKKHIVCTETKYKKIDSKENNKVQFTGTSTKINTERYSKRPSLIPKLSRPNQTNRTPRRDKSPSPTRSLKTKPIDKNLNKRQKSFTIQKNKNSAVENLQSSTKVELVSNKIISLQENVRGITTIINQKYDISPEKTFNKKPNCLQSSSSSSDIDWEAPNTSTLGILYKNISQMKETALTLSDSNNFKNQKNYIEALIQNITEIQIIADKLTEVENNSEEKYTTQVTSQENKLTSTIYKADLSNTPSELISEIAYMESNASKPNKNTKEINLTTNDSIDGIFIPSWEPPVNIEEDDENSDLDFMITLPEVKKLFVTPIESHLSLRLSDISTEAIKSLKRCPKEFTLRMDFIQGRLLFQPGKSPVNNFAVGPENMIDEKKSEIISIKPSTECIFSSEVIPVETVIQEIFSCKSIALRAVDSGIFSVVNLPIGYKNKSLNLVTKSCAHLNEAGLLLYNEHVMSMPEMTGIPNIFEDVRVDNIIGIEEDASSEEAKISHKLEAPRTDVLSSTTQSVIVFFKFISIKTAFLINFIYFYAT